MKKNLQVMGCIWLTAVMILPLQACSLFPEEEERYQVEVMHQDVTADYSLVAAQVKDVVQTKEIVCYYEQMNDEKLSFKESGKYVGTVYVQMGDKVHKGDVLARLNTEDIENKQDDLKDQVEKDQLLIKQAKESSDFYQNKLNSGECGIEDKEQYLWKVQDCGEKSRECSDDITMAKQKIDDLQKELADSVIVAGMDGTITYIWDNILLKPTESDQNVITIADTADCAFQIEDKAATTYLKAGQEVDIRISDDKSLHAIVSEIDQENSRINLSMDDNDYSLEVGTRGVITLLLATKEQVLAIPKDALHNTDDFYYVYYLDENGIRGYKKVSIGLIGDSLVEISDGLKENDSVILK